MPHAVVTGLSLISPAGATAAETFRACIEGRCAGTAGGLPRPLHRIPLATLGEMPALQAAEAKWPERSAALAILAGDAALADAGLDRPHMHSRGSAMVVGTSKAGVLTALKAADAIRNGTTPTGRDSVGGLWQWGTPACAAEALCGEFRPGGEVSSIAAACATGLIALARGAALIAEGRADTVLVVATDATIHPIFVGSFWRMGVLAAWETHPADACRPFAADRKGFVLAEGAAAVVLQAPRRRCENLNSSAVAVTGAACGNQATDLVRPADSSDVLASILALARRRAGWTDPHVDLIHAHGTGTLAGDLAETRAIRRVLGAAADRTVCISTKPITGHMLGAAGMAQAVLTVKAMQAGLVPPTANSRVHDPACDLDYNRRGSRELDVRRAICMASGFGGSSAAVALERLGSF